MPMPKSVVKFDKNGFKFTDNVDAIQYTLDELTRAALRDCGKAIVKFARAAAPTKTGAGKKQIQYWVKKKTKSVEVGIKQKGFYMLFHELGSKNHKKQAFLYNAAHDNISEIIQIQQQYLSGIESPTIESMIDEDDYEGGEENE